MTISHKPVSGASKARQVPIPLGRPLTKEMLMSLAEGLLKGVESEGKAYPCQRLSLQVAGFEERELGNMGIAGFLVKGDLANAASKERPEGQQEGDRAAKRIKVNEGIGKFFRKELDDLEAENLDALELDDLQGSGQDEDMVEIKDAPADKVEGEVLGDKGRPVGLPIDDPASHCTYTCSQCNTEVQIQDQEEHEDWHFAKALAEEDRVAAREQTAAPAASSSAPGNGSKKGSGLKKGGGGGGGGKGLKKGTAMEKGQRKLAF